jgi:hypothetical protein
LWPQRRKPLRHRRQSGSSATSRWRVGTWHFAPAGPRPGPHLPGRTPGPGHSSPRPQRPKRLQAKPSALIVAGRPDFPRAPDRSSFRLGGASPVGEAPNNSFKPNSFRSTNKMAGKACHFVCSATRVGLIQALGGLCNRFVLASLQQCSLASARRIAGKAGLGNIALARRHPGTSLRPVHAPDGARLTTHPAPTTARPGQGAPGIGRPSRRLSLSPALRASNGLPIAVVFALAALRPLARRLTVHSSRTRVAPQTAWQVQLAMLFAPPHESA